MVPSSTASWVLRISFGASLSPYMRTGPEDHDPATDEEKGNGSQKPVSIANRPSDGGGCWCVAHADD